MVGTSRVISDGCTKIDVPMIVPTTMAVACVSPIARVSCGPAAGVGVDMTAECSRGAQGAVIFRALSLTMREHR